MVPIWLSKDEAKFFRERGATSGPHWFGVRWENVHYPVKLKPSSTEKGCDDCEDDTEAIRNIATDRAPRGWALSVTCERKAMVKLCMPVGPAGSARRSRFCVGPLRCRFRRCPQLRMLAGSVMSCGLFGDQGCLDAKRPAQHRVVAGRFGRRQITCKQFEEKGGGVTTMEAWPCTCKRRARDGRRERTFCF